ncbi:hypothetical protein EBS67_16405 [bacterium]|nr:hypothetical protein [bacterium]
MSGTAKSKIFGVLDNIKKTFPALKEVLEASWKEGGLDETMDLTFEAPSKVATLPTFDKSKSRKLTPMLKARFEYASTIKYGQDIWLDPNQMALSMADDELNIYHTSLRDHWENSAPMRFKDKDLTLFGITDGCPEDRVYLVWKNEGKEPELWSYMGMEVLEFKNLEKFFEWHAGMK